MKRTLALVLSLAMLMSLVSCGSKAPSGDGPAPTNTPQGSSTSSPGGVAVEENLLAVDISFPASFFEDEDMSTFDADAYAEEHGFKKAVLNDDGSVTVTMSKAKHKELMAEMDQSAEESFAAMAQSVDTPYITEIRHSDSYDTIDIVVDRKGYDDAGFAAAFLPLTVYFSAVSYQMFAGVEQHCEITIVDAETGDAIESVVYPDALNSEG